MNEWKSFILLAATIDSFAEDAFNRFPNEIARH